MSDDYKFLKITTKPEELTEGLFGYIILHLFEVLPKLHEDGIFPCWDIRSNRYGCAPDHVIIPGLLDINYEQKEGNCKEMNLVEVRKRYAQVLGNDWEYMNMLWNTYFQIPNRIVAKADEFGDLSETLAVHYRGTDKNLAIHETQPVTHGDILLLVEDFLETHPEIRTLFLATDEASLIQKAQRAFGQHKIINTGEVELWDSNNKPVSLQIGDHAVLDCLLMSRCKYLIKCQSALSGFAKILNPTLLAYRISASKMFAEIPYFPDAYIPRLESSGVKCQKVLSRLFEGDWLSDQRARDKFGIQFRKMVRDPKNIEGIKIKRFIKRKLSFLLKKLF